MTFLHHLCLKGPWDKLADIEVKNADSVITSTMCLTFSKDITNSQYVELVMIYTVTF